MCPLPSGVPPARSSFLDYYAEADAEIFFGRDSEIVTATSQIQATRLFVLTGESGAGKTSLLLAGILPRLRSKGLLAVPIRFFDDPLTNVKQKLSDLGRHRPEQQALPAATDDKATTLAPTSSLADWILALQTRTRTPLVLALDQFEEFFTRFPIQAQQRLISELAEVLVNRDISVHFILALREDVFARLHMFRSQIPTIFDHTLHLRRLEESQAEKAIVGPLNMFEAHFEPDLVQAILADLSQEGEIQPPHLQIVCDRIYQHLLESDEQVATQALYEHLGRAENILAQYLEDVLKALPEPQQETSRAILKALVTSERMKDLLTASEVADLAGLDSQLVEDAIAHLVNLRLLRPVRHDIETPEGVVRYELAHDRLAQQISEWISEPERQARKAKEILRRGLVSWRDHKLSLRPEELQVIAEQRVNPYLKLDAEEGELLLSSALHHDSEIREWIDRLEGFVDIVAALIEGLGGMKAQVRKRAAQWLGEFKDPRAADKLLDSALKDEATSVRRQAAESLVSVDESAKEKLVAELSDREMRVNAAKALWDHRRVLALQPQVWLRAGAITGWEYLKDLVHAMPTFTRRRLLPATVLILLAAGLAILAAVRLDRTPTRMDVDKENWTIALRNRFNYAFNRIEMSSDIVKAEIVDVDHDGRGDVLVATGGEGDKPGYIIALHTEGDVLWEFDTHEEKYGRHHGRFVVIDFQVADLFNTGEEKIVFTARDEAWFPSRLGILDFGGQHQASYWHPGFVDQFVVDNFDNDSDLEVLARADNNNLRTVLRDDAPGNNYQVAFLVDSRNLEGQAFPPAIEGLQSGHELWYAVMLPQGQSVTEVKALDYDGDGILDAALTVGDGIYYYVNADGMLLGTRLSDAYIGAHPDESLEVQVALIRKDENGEWEMIPIPTLSDEGESP
jgi:hypothetical protein